MLNPNLIGLKLADVTKEPIHLQRFTVVIGFPRTPDHCRYLCLWNGILVAYGRIEPMVATLILMIAGRGIAQLVTNAIKIIIYITRFLRSGNGWVFLLPFALYIAALCSRLPGLSHAGHPLDCSSKSVGINSRSSFFSGIDEKKIKLFAYVFCGICAGIAGLIARLEYQNVGCQ